MVSFMVNAPVALICLVEDERQVFAGAHGLAPPWDQQRQTPLSHSFCQHVVTSGAPLVVECSRTDARVAGNGAIEDLDVQSYLGVPLVTQDGPPLGAL
jgi:GAF domain-containing protein